MPDSGIVQVFAEVREALLRFLVLRGASSADAEDIIQEVHLKLLSDKLGPVSEPRAYLYKMVSNHMLGLRRSAARRSRREEDWMEAHGVSQGEVEERPSIETELIAREQLAILQRVVDGLPERTRGIFRRFRIDGEPQRQIAADLEISVSAVEKHLARAYAAIAAAKLRLDGENKVSRHPIDEGSRHGT